MRQSIACIAGLMLLGVATTASAVLVTFTGGTRTHIDGTTSVTTAAQDGAPADVDFYVEGGFKLDFINTAGGGEHLGDYYGQDASGNWNDVIHGHWRGNDLSSIDITKVGGGTFDINAFTLTSNTFSGGSVSGNANGNEQAWVQAWVGGVLQYSQLLSPDSWGWKGVHNPGPLQNDPVVLLGSQFDAVDMVRFTVLDPSTGVFNPANVLCFGMDDFFINEPAPTPEPGILALLATGLAGIFGIRRRFRK